MESDIYYCYSRSFISKASNRIELELFATYVLFIFFCVCIFIVVNVKKKM